MARTKRNPLPSLGLGRKLMLSKPAGWYLTGIKGRQFWAWRQPTREQLARPGCPVRGERPPAPRQWSDGLMRARYGESYVSWF